jgi:DNA-binding NtrC family response regulator
VALASNVRIIAATNRNLRDLIAQGLFREDLFFRLNVIHIVVPPLRERREDIPMLVEHFLRSFTDSVGVDGTRQVLGPLVSDVSPEAMDALRQAPWPGNVRQLENVVERLIVTARRERIELDDLPSEVRMPAASRKPIRERRRTVADDLFQKLVEDRQSFWTAVYPLYMNREITRANVRDLVHKGLEEARGNYKIVAKLFNLEPREYKRFLNFLRKHDCQLPFKEYRQ